MSAAGLVNGRPSAGGAMTVTIPTAGPRSSGSGPNIEAQKQRQVSPDG